MTVEPEEEKAPRHTLSVPLMGCCAASEWVELVKLQLLFQLLMTEQETKEAEVDLGTQSQEEVATFFCHDDNSTEGGALICPLAEPDLDLRLDVPADVCFLCFCGLHLNLLWMYL